MKKDLNRYFMWGVAVFFLAACSDHIEKQELPKVDVEDPTTVKDLDFAVQINGSQVYKVGDTVRFKITGNADLIDFYSGTFGNAYEYVEEDRFYDITANFSFQTGKSPDNQTEANWDCAKLMYSTDFNGERTGPNAYASAKAATWLPVPHSFLIKGQPEGIAEYQDSGTGDITDIFEEGGPVYLAWHCTTQAESNRVTFRVLNSIMEGVVIDNPKLSTRLYTQGQLDFKWAENGASADQPSNRPTVTSTQLQWNGVFGNKSPGTATHPLQGQFKEGYAISGPLTLPKFNAGRDKPNILVPQNNGTWPEYQFIYKRAGEYDVVFIGSKLKGTGEPILQRVKLTINE